MPSGGAWAEGDRHLRGNRQKRHGVANVVLTHGAYKGGYIWRRGTPILRAAGHDVFTPTLTGFGERFHLGSPETTMDTFIQDIVGVLEFEDLW